MEKRFNLIKSDFEKHETRILPRFPFCYLTFKPDNSSRVYEIKDISLTGMQISLKDDETAPKEDTLLKGEIHWLGKILSVSGMIKWQTQNRLGIEFIKKKEHLQGLENFLHIQEMVKRLKPLHKLDHGLEIPARLKYWLNADGPVEVFVWNHSDGEIAKFQLLYLTTFFEWEDGIGSKTGRVLSKRSVDSPLLTEDEWVFHIDQDLDGEKLECVKSLIFHIPDELLPDDLKTFIVRQLS